MQRLRTVTLLDVSAVSGHHAMPAALLLAFMNSKNFMLSGVEREKSFITFGPDFGQTRNAHGISQNELIGQMLTKNLSNVSFGVGENSSLFLNHFTKGDEFCHFLFASWSEKNSKKGITIQGKV